MGGVPSVPTDPSRRLQVIGAGYSRTGTVSMQMALTKLLNGPVIHGGTLILEGSDAYCRAWIDAYKAKRRGDREETLKCVRRATAGFVGTTDLPTIDFIPELVELYPEAKVVLVSRNPERWARSVEGLGKHTTLWWLPYLMWPVPGWRWFPTFIDQFTESSRRYEVPKEQRDDADNDGPIDPNMLLAHNDWVRSIVPKEKLLEMELGEGWAPLCKFLGVPVPDEPFPRANDTDAAMRYAKSIFKRLAQVWLGTFSVSGVVAYSVFRLYKG
ncbi:hypothetical protein DL766_005762 [Monosporascus sp. MC13-8B]|uniref:NAD dependent epimerase/dehydratase n=1 Tax=Monosporascus cannonballus TaxID=155416 RepID=A0ABY0GZF6_9PEZI|nr:hypothetical protein DL763_011069 [Monosporascus cannonballus]RYO78124.1 hypothetical protein DL762_008861 [Monosporascus cannonballus]RYP28662.1 hypothetical protein DL766_005762 [Monosporascus sp. MC13-8B]